MTGLSDTMSPGNLSQPGAVRRDRVPRRVPGRAAAAGAALLARPGAVGLRRPHLEHRAELPASTSPPPRGGSARYRYEVVLEPHNRHWLFALETAASLPRARAHELRRPDRVELRRCARACATSCASVIAPEPQPSESRGRAAPRAAPARRASTRARARSPRSGARPPTTTPQVLARAIAFLRQGRYVYTLEPPLLGAHSVDEFLFSTKEGFCEHFSSAFVFLMRAAGVPARVVTGYQGGELNPVDSIITVRQSDAHAWAEVFLAGRGWVRVDPTAAAVPGRVESGMARAVPQAEALPLMMRPRARVAARRARPLGGGGAQVERLGARLQPGAPARPDGERRHARRRLAHADRDAVRLPRRDDAGAARLVAQAPGAPRPGAEGLARVLPQARRARRRARARTRARATTPRARRAPCPPRGAASCASARCTSRCATARRPRSRRVARLRRLVREL